MHRQWLLAEVPWDLLLYAEFVDRAAFVRDPKPMLLQGAWRDDPSGYLLHGL